jgi:hypothetical protein
MSVTLEPTAEQHRASEALSLEFDRVFGPRVNADGTASIRCENDGPAAEAGPPMLVFVAEDGRVLRRVRA